VDIQTVRITLEAYGLDVDPVERYGLIATGAAWLRVLVTPWTVEVEDVLGSGRYVVRLDDPDAVEKLERLVADLVAPALAEVA
jgi:hypothetical protein